MNKLYLLLIGIIVSMLWSSGSSYAVTVGNPLDLDIPPRSAMLRQQAVNQTLDEYEEVIKVKSAVDLEFLFDKELHTTSEVTRTKIEGQYQMLKLGITVFDRVEPYIKVGNSHLKVKWRQNDAAELEVNSENNFTWGGGLKVVVWDFENIGLRITADGQYRTIDADVEKCLLNGVAIRDNNPRFDVAEWQGALLVSKKLEIPLKGSSSIYMVPYTGVTVSDSKADVKFADPNNPGADYTLFDANNKSFVGFVTGIDILPSLRSPFTCNLELRLADEIALSLGGAMKF